MVFGIGNPLIDVVIQATDQDLHALAIDKGIMTLVTPERQQEILAHFEGRPRVYRPGGSAPNTMMALAGLGISAAISGKIGNDDFGATYRRQAEAYGITSRLVVGNGPTGSSIILVTPDGERSMNTHLGMCREFGIADLDSGLLAATKAPAYLYFTGYMWDTENQKGAIRAAIEIAKANGISVAFDVADPFAVQRYKTDFLDLIANHVDLVFANEREASLLFDTTTRETTAAAFGRIVPLAALKVGKDGSYLIEAGRATPVRGRPIIATDSNGAGDMFAAGFLAGLQWGKSPLEAARIAGHLAEEIIQHVGAQFSIEEIRAIRAQLS